MCGIAGFLASPGSPLALDHDLRTMLATLVHRGPDDEGRWVEPASGLALGMRRLSIIDLAGGTQPVWNEDRRIGVVFNGEIYNHASLRDELRARGHTFRSHSDTEVLVHLYEEMGPALLDRLQGMYAIALVDLIAQRLLLARDPFGQKPLFVTTGQPAPFAFASEIKALHALPWCPPAIDETAYLDYLGWLSLPAPRTHWRGIEKFAPGEWRQLDLATARMIACGRTPALCFAATPNLLTAADAATALEPALLDSVRRHLAADVPVGVLLSGGSDSLALGLALTRLRPGRLHTFTAGYAETDNEFPEAARTAALIGSEHHEIHLDSSLLADSLPPSSITLMSRSATPPPSPCARSAKRPART